MAFLIFINKVRYLYYWDCAIYSQEAVISPEFQRQTGKQSITPVNKDYAPNSIHQILPLWCREETWTPGHDSSLTFLSETFFLFSSWPGGFGLISSACIGMREKRAFDCPGEDRFREHPDLRHLWPRSHNSHLQMTEVDNTRSGPFQPNPFTSVSHDNCWPSPGNTRIPSLHPGWFILFWNLVSH